MRNVLILVVLLAGCSNGSPQPGGSPQASGTPAPTGKTLVVDDAAAANPALVSSPLTIPGGASHAMRLPPGKQLTVWASGFSRPRFMVYDDAGALLVADAAGKVYRCTGATPTVLLSGLDAPTSLALHGGYLYIGETGRVSRVRYPAVGTPEAVVPDLPRGGHDTRTVAFGPDGKLYLSIGSSCNICDETDERRAAVSRYNPDGSGYEHVAGGLRNAVGLAFQPGSGLLWATCNERDMQGNEIPPDLVTVVKAGATYGWPNCFPFASPCPGVTTPTLGIQAHSAPLGLAFASAEKLYVAQHGSWNRTPPAEPKLLQIDLQGAQPTAVHVLASGWQDAAGNRWGRPAGVTVAPDGALMVSDDAAGLIYRLADAP
jgi:glucose/arabinose dehydrogenase